MGQPSLQVAKTTRGPRVVRALRAGQDYNSLGEAFCFALRGIECEKASLPVELRRSKTTLLNFIIMLLLLHSYKRPCTNKKLL